MAVSSSYPSTTARFALPLLFPGQAQKEFFINQSLSLIDAVMQGGVAQSLSAPPEAPVEGSSYRINSTATGEWADHGDAIAIRIGGDWHFVEPHLGMTVFDRHEGVFIHYNSGWKTAIEPLLPTGGGTVDFEARQAIGGLVEALRNLGLFTNS